MAIDCVLGIKTRVIDSPHWCLIDRNPVLGVLASLAKVTQRFSDRLSTESVENYCRYYYVSNFFDSIVVKQFVTDNKDLVCR